MAKLHMWERNVRGEWVKAADGDGDISYINNFDVRITWGSVRRDRRYQIRQGTSVNGPMARCDAGANVGETARFNPAERQELVVAAEAGIRSAQNLRAALLAAQKTVSIEIDLEDLKTLKAANYKLCFAKKVGTAEYNVVWQAYGDYLAYNNFSWTPTYQLFGSNTFQSNITVRVATNRVDIGLGEQSTLDEAGVLSPASTGGSATAITMINQFGPIHPGVNQLSTGINGEQISTPIYVATDPIVLGSAELTPVEKVLVWFEQNIETSTMFSNARSNSVEIDLTMRNEATRLYQGGVWTTP